MSDAIEASLRRLKERCWGAFGDDDTLGTLNYMSNDTRASAASYIIDGDAISLSRPVRVGHEGESALYMTNEPRRDFVMAATDPVASEGSVPWNIESWSLTYHGLVMTHADAWNHCSWHGEAYNGRTSKDLVTEVGEITQGSKMGVFGRGVLLDAAPEGGWLEPGTAVTTETLDRLEEALLDKPIGKGDVVLVRTGQTLAMRESVGGFSPSRGMPACHWKVCEWLQKKQVAVFGSDSANDCQPALVNTFANPVHVLSLVGMGMPLLDNLDLEALAAKCKEKNRYSFALTCTPLALQGGTGSPVNPIALF